MSPTPRRALALRRNFLIGLVHDNPNAQMVLGMQQGILGVLADTEYELIVRPVNRGSQTMADDIRAFLTRQRLHGIVLLPPISENDALAALCDELGCRYVRMGSAQLDQFERAGRLQRPRDRARSHAVPDRAGPSNDRHRHRPAGLPLGVRAPVGLSRGAGGGRGSRCPKR